MTEEQLQEIVARCDGATPGPWESGRIFKDVAGDYGVWVAGTCKRTYIANVGQMTEPVLDPAEDNLLLFDAERKNAVFIAAARTDVPALCKEVRRLQEALEHIVTLCQEGRARWKIQDVAERALRGERESHKEDTRV